MSSSGQHAGSHKLTCPINSLRPVCAWHCIPSLPLAAYELVGCEQWNSEVEIPLVLVHWAGRRESRVGWRWGVLGVLTPPWGMLTEAPTLTHWSSNWPTQMGSEEERSGWFSDPAVWAGYNGTVCFTNPVLSAKSKFYSSTLEVKSNWRRKISLLAVWTCQVWQHWGFVLTTELKIPANRL